MKLGGSGESRTDSAQILAESEIKKMRFPEIIKYRRFQATIYGKGKNYPYYRLAYYAAGKRHIRNFRTYGETKTEADRKVRELANGSQAAALSAQQSRDALVALEQLQGFCQSTGRRVSLLAAVSEFVEASRKLNGRTMGEAVEGYLRNVASVKRKDLKEAVAEFLQVDAPRTHAANGQRAQLSAKYAYNRKLQLDRFADTFQNTAVNELSKEHLDKFIGSLDDFSAKSRNHYRAAVRQFLQWAVRKDYLAPTHRLLEADAMRPERANTSEIAFYTPREFATLLGNADASLRPAIAISGLAGLRTEELLRLIWEDVWRVPGHIEVTAGKAKTRQRRLVKTCPALAVWLKPYRLHKSGKLWISTESIFQKNFLKFCGDAKITRKTNGLRHAFCTYHYAAHANENLTGQQAGHSPAMIHSHYKGLATKAEAEKWFNVLPTKSAKNVIR
jgi:site-specific recombinase XerD